MASGRSDLALLHRVVGALALLAFVLSGAILRTHVPPLPELPPARHGAFVSRHIYILAAAVANLVLGAYVVDLPGRGRRTAQVLGSVLLTGSAMLLMIAFVVEPLAGRGRTPTSSIGLFALLGGAVLHVLAAWRR